MHEVPISIESRESQCTELLCKQKVFLMQNFNNHIGKEQPYRDTNA